jgi:hypothetical protein
MFLKESRHTPNTGGGDVLTATFTQCALVVIFSSLQAQADDSDLLELVRAGHRQARESIVSIHAQYRPKSASRNKIPDLVRDIEWWQSGTSFRWRNIEKGIDVPRRDRTDSSPKKKHETTKADVTTEGFVVDGILKSVKRMVVDGKTATPAVDVATPQSLPPAFADLWTRAGFLVSEKPRISLLDLISNPECIKLAQNEDLDGEPCIRVECTAPENQYVQAWFARRAGFLAKRSKIHYGKPDKSTRYLEFEVTVFREHEGGLFFPERTFMRYYDGKDPNTPREVTETVFELVEINKPIRKEDLLVQIPSGSQVIDRQQNLAYTMGKDGKPSPDHPIVPIPDPAALQTHAIPKDPNRNWTWWAIGIGSLLLFLYVGYRISRKHWHKYSAP